MMILLTAATTTWANPDTPADQKNGDTKEKKWDVNKLPGPFHVVPIDTETGTWMSLDVRPDGKEILFDLLGDLYTIPIEGGLATPLTEDVAWNMQPRYSPDGTKIAFTSDRNGGDNIWVMNADGSKAHAVTEERYRLLNSPTWSPDGNFIAARKHFTSRRSLGAGEIWLYHVTGGNGVQMVKRYNDQKDLGEPCFSADGRHLFYSRDSTPGAVFQYNKDPNKSIYSIERLDRASGEIKVFVRGQGGALRPTPSPDGKTLAYVKRIRNESVIMLHDMTSGTERVLTRDLDRDMQETWAIHGVYPAFAWTPDNGSIVYWAGGKIHRVEVATSKVEIIPFRVHSQRKITHALRVKHEVAPARFPVRMLRWTSVAPNGLSVVFQSLGQLYRRSVPEGSAKRLTNNKEGFEFYPSFSRAGDRVVFVGWSDEALGSVRVVSANGGKARALPTGSGHFAEPVFSHDGTHVIYRKIAGGGLVSPLWSHETGIYRINIKNGKIDRVRDDAQGLHFGPDPDRLFFYTVGAKGERTLKSIGLAQHDERDHATSERASEFRVSPNGRWLAFVEAFNVYVTSFPQAGRPVAIGPKSKSLPLRRLSKVSGSFVSWTGDSGRVFWSLGRELFQQSLADAFPFLGGASAKATEPQEHGTIIGFEAKSDVPRGAIAFKGARLVTMRGSEVIEDGVIVVRDNRISHVGKLNEVLIPEDALVIDARGTTIIPGIIDVHSHSAHAVHRSGITPQTNWENYALLAFGVTTIHDPSNRSEHVFAASEMARAGLIVAPRTYSTGTILYGASGWFRADVDNLEDATNHLRRMKALGAITVKSYNQPRRDQRQQIVAAARALNMMVVTEGGALFQHNMNMIVDGHTGVEHAIPVANAYDDVLQLWSRSETGYTPTLGIAYGGLAGENYWYQHTKVWAHPRLQTFVPREILDPKSRRPRMADESDWNHISVARFVTRLANAGAMVQVGGHGQREGLAAHWEMWMMVQGGMTPHQALKTATLSGAKYIGLDQDLGSLDPGRLADLVVIEGNPLKEIRDSEKIRFTMVNGRLYDAKTMDEVGHHAKKRPRFYWESNSPESRR